MKNSKRFKDYKTIQKTGILLIISGAAIIISKIFGVLQVGHFVEENLPSYLFLLGAFLMSIPFLLKKLSGKTSKTVSILIIALCTSISVVAQDYSKQVGAFAKSLTEKDVTALNQHLSPELKFDPIPVANTPTVINNIVKQLPKLISMTVLKNENGKAKVKYDFEALGVSESFIYFDETGKIVRIELIENLIKQEMEAQKQMKQSVQQPVIGELAKKHPYKEIEFKSNDGLLIAGNLYEVDKDKPVILLCHQAGYNKFEYADIAPKLNELGYNCLAIDQRSGGDFAGKSNNTFQRAKEKELATDFTDVQQDIDAAINFLHKKYNKKITIWGSSYSSSLVLFESLKNDKVNASISFSPGDYFGDTKESLATVFSKIGKPFLVTSSKQEVETLKTLVDNSKLKQNQLQFIPKSNGFHGSRALWTGQKGAEEYWTAVIDFLTKVYTKK